MDNKVNTLLDMIKNGTTQSKAFTLFDQLDTIDNEFMFGKWTGEEIKSGHPMDGLLTLASWHGKEFIDSERVIPLVFEDKKNKLYYVEPNKVFKYKNFAMNSKTIKKIINKDIKFNKHNLDFLFKVLKTKKDTARLRKVEYRGKSSSSMIYDKLSIIDVFRKIDGNTVMGVMDFKGDFNNLGYFFILRRK